MSTPRKKKSSRTGAQQINKHFHFLATPLRLVNRTDSAAREHPSNHKPANVLAGRRSSDKDDMDLFDRWLSLSEREQDVTYLVCEGHTNHQIALRLGVSDRTVKSYLEHVFFKMNVPNRVELRLKFAGFDFRRRTPYG